MNTKFLTNRVLNLRMLRFKNLIHHTQVDRCWKGVETSASTGWKFLPHPVRMDGFAKGCGYNPNLQRLCENSMSSVISTSEARRNLSFQSEYEISHPDKSEFEMTKRKITQPLQVGDYEKPIKTSKGFSPFSFGRSKNLLTVIEVVSMKIILTLFVILSLTTQLYSQKQPLPMFTAATNDKVYILVVGAPRDMEGFNVYRKAVGEKEFTLLNQTPITAIVDPSAARQMLGDDFRSAAQALNVEDEFDVVRRLKSDPGMATALSFTSLNIAKVAGRLFVDEKMSSGSTYKYRVEFIAYDGTILFPKGWNPAITERDVTIKDRKPPSPKKIECKAEDGEVKISWDYPPYSGNPDDIVVGFNVYRKSQTGEFEKINKTPILRQEDLKYRTDAGVENNQSYSYYVRTVDFIGRESDPSQTISAMPKDATPPSFPENIQAIAEEGKILVTWKMNLELDLSYYDIYKSDNMHQGFKKINSSHISGDQPRYYDNDVYAGPYFYYKVKAIDKSGNESEFSNVAVGHPLDKTPPLTPEKLHLTAQKNHRVKLQWQAEREKDLQGFYVYRREEKETSFMRITGEPKSKDVLQYEDPGYSNRGLTPGKTYIYAVSAVDNSFNESKMIEDKITIPDDEAPTSPVDSYARGTPDGFVQIGWQPSMSLDVVKYRVYRGESKKTASVLRDLNLGVYEMIDSSGTMGKEYFYQVAAVDAAGNESKRTEKSIVVPRDPVAPNAPENVKAVANKNVGDSKGVTITWDAVRAGDLVGYNIYSSELPNSNPTKLNKKIITETRFTDPKGKAGLYYRVSAIDTSGHENAEGAAVEAVSEKK